MTFVATTALKSHWTLQDEVVFLGPWCHSTVSGSFEVAHQLLPDPLAIPQDLAAARAFVDATYEDALSDLVLRLEAMHGVKHSLRYWRILVGSWLHMYVSVIYDRYLGLTAALQKFPDFETFVCLGDEFEGPQDSYEFYYRLCSDEYNLYLYSRVLFALGHRFETRPLKAADVFARDPREVPVRRFLKSAAGVLFDLQQLRRPCNAPLVLLEDTYLGLDLEWRLKLALGRRCEVRVHGPTVQQSRAYSSEMRSKLEQVIAPRSEFHSVLGQLIARDIPRVLVEEFHELCRNGERRVPPAGSVIVSAGAWHHNDQFKHYAAIASERNCTLVGLQHGGTYGFHEYVPHYHHEKKITDRFFSWGWTSSDSSNVRPSISSKLSRSKPPRRNGDSRRILYIGTAEPRYSHYLQVRPHQFKMYLDRQERFLASLPPHLHDDLFARLYPVDFGWSLTERWFRTSPRSRLDSKKVLLDSLNDARVVVIDALTTTWLEALHAGVPMILLLDLSELQLRPDAQAAIDSMASVGIVHATPEGAADFLARNCDRIERWWSATEVQLVRKLVLEKFACTDVNPVEFFRDELMHLIDAPHSLHIN